MPKYVRRTINRTIGWTEADDKFMEGFKKRGIDYAEIARLAMSTLRRLARQKDQGFTTVITENAAGDQRHIEDLEELIP